MFTTKLINFQITKNKSFEYELLLGGETKNFEDFIFSLSFTSKESHAGPAFDFGIKNLFRLSLMIYDHRHWDHINCCWENGQ